MTHFQKNKQDFNINMVIYDSNPKQNDTKLFCWWNDYVQPLGTNLFNKLIIFFFRLVVCCYACTVHPTQWDLFGVIIECAQTLHQETEFKNSTNIPINNGWQFVLWANAIYANMQHCTCIMCICNALASLYVSLYLYLIHGVTDRVECLQQP